MSAGPRCVSRAVAVGHHTGATLVELLVALALMSLALGTVSMLASAVLAGFEADPAAADEQQRVRSGVNALIDDVRRAGSGFLQAPDDGPGAGLPALVPDTVVTGAWPVRAMPHTLAAIYALRNAAHARLRTAAAAGDFVLKLDRPAFCSAIAITCGFAAGDDVLVFDEHGRVAVMSVSQVLPPLDLELTSALREGWRAGASVSSATLHVYSLRPDPATGLSQLVRALGAGPANPVIDFVTRFDVEWHLAAAVPSVRLAPDGTLAYATAGPLPPPSGITSEPQWPPGENCAYATGASGAHNWRSQVAALPVGALGAFSDGPWCPSAAAPSRWDADLARVTRVTVTLGVAVASARLRPPASVLLGGGRGARVVPDITVVAELTPGAHNGRR